MAETSSILRKRQKEKEQERERRREEQEKRAREAQEKRAQAARDRQRASIVTGAGGPRRMTRPADVDNEAQRSSQLQQRQEQQRKQQEQLQKQKEQQRLRQEQQQRQRDRQRASVVTGAGRSDRTPAPEESEARRYRPPQQREEESDADRHSQRAPLTIFNRGTSPTTLFNRGTQFGATGQDNEQERAGNLRRQLLNTWSRPTEPAPRRFYDVEQRGQVGVGDDRVDRGATGLFGTQPESDTVGLQWRPTGPMQGPRTREEAERDRPQVGPRTATEAGAGFLLDSPLIRAPLEWGMRVGGYQGKMPGSNLPVGTSPLLGGDWGALPRTDVLPKDSGPGGWTQPFTESAAYDRFKFNRDQAREEQPTVQEWVQEEIRGAPQRRQEYGRLWNDWRNGKIGFGEMLMQMQQAGANPPPNLLGQGARELDETVFGGVQAAQDWMNTRNVPDVSIGNWQSPAGTTVGNWYASVAKGAQAIEDPDKLKATGQPYAVANPMAAWQAFWTDYGKEIQNYRNATRVPARMGPSTNQWQQANLKQGQKPDPKALELAQLNWATPQSVESTYRDLTERPERVENWKGYALAYQNAASNATSEAERTYYNTLAADAYAQAYQLENAHPQEIVNQNTDVWAQLQAEILQPDVTDLMGFGLARFGLTPGQRRLSRAEAGVAGSQAEVAAHLKNMALGPQARIASQVPPDAMMNRLLQNTIGTTGYSRAEMAANDMYPLVTMLLSDVDTAADAKLLMTTLARNPAQLVEGMDASLFSSPGLQNRAVNGKVSFGGMGMDSRRFSEGLNVYRTTAEDLLANSKALNAEGPLNKVDFMQGEFAPAMLQGGYQRYGVATEVGEAPMDAVKARTRTFAGNQAAVEYLDAKGNVLSMSDRMSIMDANKKATAFTKEFKKGVAPNERSWLNTIGNVSRGIVTPIYLLSQPGSWATNIIGATSIAAGDGKFNLGNVGSMKPTLQRIYGGMFADRRMMEGVDSAANVGKEMGGPLGRWYGKIDETAAVPIMYNATMEAIDKMLPPSLKAFGETLKANGITDPKAVNNILDHLHQTARSGGDMTAALNHALDPNTRFFNVSGVNPYWLDVLPAGSVEELHRIVNTTQDPAQFAEAINKWDIANRTGWEAQLAEAPAVPQQYSWMKQENAQDLTDMEKIDRLAQKNGVDLTDWKKQQAEKLKEIEQRQEMLTQLVADSKDPKNRYILYNIWGQMYDQTSLVRAELAKRVENTYALTAGLPKEEAAPIWQREFFGPARELWDARNAKYDDLMEEGTGALRTGQDFSPNYDYWKRLEQTAATPTKPLEEQLLVEPGSGRYDPRLAQNIAASRALVDKAVAETFLAARRFNSEGAFDQIISAEKVNQMAGAQAAKYLDDLYQKMVLKDDNYAGFLKIRNEVWRQYTVYAQTVQRMATRNVIEEGLAAERRTGLRFDAGLGDGQVELLYPTQKQLEYKVNQKPAPGQRRQPVEQTDTYDYWVVRREDGTITSVPDSNVPAELKQRYNGVTPARIEEEVQMEMDNIASAEPVVRQAPAPEQVAGTTAARAGGPEVSAEEAERIRRELNLGNQANVPDLETAARITSRNNTALGGIAPPDSLAHGAGHALQTLDQIKNYLLTHADEILKPSGGTNEGGALRILSEFRRQMLPVWDNIRFAARDYADRSRSFSLLDRSNKTRVDELMGVFQPYSFFYTRTAKNALERMIFEPQIWRRVQQYKQGMAEAREQEGEPDRYGSGMRVVLPDGSVHYLNLNPTKYWPTLSSMLFNDYADPESANSAFGWAMENAQMTGQSFYPWWDAAKKGVEGRAQDIYVPNYAPIGKIAAWGAASQFGHIPVPEGAPAGTRNLMRPEFYEYNLQRELTTMVTEGKITQAEATMAGDILNQEIYGREPLPEQELMDQDKLQSILDEAAKRAGGSQYRSSWTSWLTGVADKPFDTDEMAAIEANQQYHGRGYDQTENPFGSNAAENATLAENPELIAKWAQSASMDETKERPGIASAEAMKREEKQRISAEMATAVDQAILTDPALTEEKIKEIEKPYREQLKALDAKYPSVEAAGASDGAPKGSSPFEQARWELERILKTSEEGMPVFPEGGTQAEKNAWRTAYNEWKKGQLDQIEGNIKTFMEQTGSPNLDPDFAKVNSEFEQMVRGRYASELYNDFKQKYDTDLRRTWEDYETLREELSAEDRAKGQANIEASFTPAQVELFGQYNSLEPKSQEKKDFAKANPILYLMNDAYYDPEEFNAVAERYGENWVAVHENYPQHPGSDASKEAKAAFYDKERAYLNKYPDAQKLNLWVDGRRRPGGMPPEYYPGYGVDYGEAEKLFPGVLDAIANTPDPDKVGWPAFYDYKEAHPEIDGYYNWLYEYADLTPEQYMGLYPASPEATTGELVDPYTYTGERPVGSGRSPIGGGTPLTDPNDAWLSVGRFTEPGPPEAPAESGEWPNANLSAPLPPGEQPIPASTYTGKEPPKDINLQPADRLNIGAAAEKDTNLSSSGRTAKDYITSSESYQERQAKSAKWKQNEALWAGRKQTVVDQFGDEAGAVWDEYYKLPKGKARADYKDAHPELKIYTIAAFHPEDYKAMSEIFTTDDMLDWAYAPAWDGTEETDELRSEYWAKNPQGFLVGSWINGRPKADNERDFDPLSEDYEYNFGADYTEAMERFGDNIWATVSEYKQLYGDKAAQKAFRDAHPEYNEWSEWWYENLPDQQFGSYSGKRSGPGYDSLGHRAYGSWGGGGYGGGGGGSGGGYVPRVDTPYIQPRYMNSSLWNSPEFREWRPDWISTRPDESIRGRGLKRTWA